MNEKILIKNKIEQIENKIQNIQQLINRPSHKTNTQTQKLLQKINNQFTNIKKLCQ